MITKISTRVDVGTSGYVKRAQTVLQGAPSAQAELHVLSYFPIWDVDMEHSLTTH